jgi:hypothetical protein
MKTPESSLEEIVEEAYGNTLKPWHGWISSAAYKVSAPFTSQNISSFTRHIESLIHA